MDYSAAATMQVSVRFWRVLCSRSVAISSAAILWAALSAPACGAEPADQESSAADQEFEISDSITVEPGAADPDIAARLTRILRATGWFQQPRVQVEEGIVFLSGESESEQHKDWAGRLARNTEGVLAVVNRVKVIERSMWDLSPTWDKLLQLAAAVVRALPLLLVGALLLVATWFMAKWSARGVSTFLSRRISSVLLAQVVARAAALPVFLLGLYVVLSISGLTGLALSVIGGTGLIGLVIGFAFRDIAENFLASLLISMQRPFATGDLIEVAGHTGLVRRVNTRATLLMTLEGNHVQIPNATIYKQTITNFTANPNARFDFTVGIGYEDSIAQAQTVALSVLRDHVAVLDDPEPLVLAESLGAATVNLRIYFWVDGTTYSWLKVRSSMIRLTKRALDEAGISMPDEAREVVFPDAVPVRMLSPDEAAAESRPRSAIPEEELNSHSAEGHLTSESDDIEKQARNARVPEGGQNLLES